MGEITDMMLEGTLCEVCGVYLGREGEGFPVKCKNCSPKTSKKIKCETCPKRFPTMDAMRQHHNDAHKQKVI